MDVATWHIRDEEQMEAFGAALAPLLQPGDVIGLRGDLGAGKTFLAGAVSRAMCVPDSAGVSSPTFTLINEYRDGRLPVYHMDLYRLTDAAELYELGLWEYYRGEGVCLVEWCDRFADLWPEDAMVLSIGLLAGEEREVVATGAGRGAALVAALREKMTFR